MKTKTKAIIAYLIVLLAGFAAGYTVHFIQTPDTYNQWNRPADQERWDHERGREGHELGIGQSANERLSKVLALQDDQKAPFYREIWEFRRGVRNEIHNRRDIEKEWIRQRYSDFRQNISDILTDEQLTKLDRFAHPDSVESRRSMRGQRR